MEITSSLVNDKTFIYVKDSLIKASEKDHKENFRVKLLEYINDISDNDDDEFFFNMLEFVRFLIPNNEATAYTDINHLIFMNVPSAGPLNIGESVTKWEFIYDHECMHQLWETFDVAKQIEKEGLKYDHYLLNIASDCVINDYLKRIRKKDIPDGIITPKYLKENYGVEYDVRHDTQYTLYLKLLEKEKELKKDKNLQQQCGEEDSNQNSGQGGQSNQNGQSSQSGQSGQGGKGKSNNPKTAEDAQKSADNAKKAAEDAQKAADEAKKNGDKDADKKQKSADNAKKAAEDAQKAADEAKKAKEAGDKKGEEEAAKKAKNAENIANNAKNEAKGEQEKGHTEENDPTINSKDNNSSNNSGGTGHGKNDGTNEYSDVNLDELRKKAEEFIEEARRKISGDLGSFLKKCQASKELKEDGLVVQTDKGMSLWNNKVNNYVKSYIKMKVFQKHREFKRTYQKVKRGSGLIKFGQPIMRGKKLKDDKLLINVAFYVDRSGSMSGTIDNVFEAAYVIAEGLKKQFSKDKVVSGLKFKMITFDDVIEEIPWGKKVHARGGNLSMHDYIKKLEELTGDYLVNVFITDGQFTMDKSKIQKMLDNLKGCFLYVTNQGDATMEELSKENKTKLFYIEADSEFKIK